MAKKKRGFLEGYATYDTSEGFGDPREWRNAFYGRMGIDEAEKLLSGLPVTPHQILGVAPGATADEIKKAFRRLMMEWHPDHNQHRAAQADEQSKKIIAAYTKLTQPK